MRIGLFTDTYRPSTNGIVTVIEITRKHLEAMGHEVFVFCPADKFKKTPIDDDKIIRFTAVKGMFFDDYRTSLFFPPATLRQIKKLKLDVIHYFTPGQIGLMAVYAGRKTNTVTVAQHSTDVYQYIEHYPMAVPGVILLSSILPLTVKFDKEARKRFVTMYLPKLRKGEKVSFGRRMIEGAVTILYGGSDAAVMLSKKSMNQIQSWKGSEKLNLVTIPTGVDPIPLAGDGEIQSFRQRWGIADTDEVFCYIGRLGSEKNLELLIPAAERVIAERPNAKLLFVGDFEFGDELKRMAKNSQVPDRIVFTGMLPRETLGAAYGASDIFVFPSLTDTQGLVLHEAVGAGLPVVMIDPDLSFVVEDGKNGYITENNPEDFADKILAILGDAKLKSEFSKHSRKLAAEYSELGQTKKLVELYTSLGAGQPQ